MKALWAFLLGCLVLTVTTRSETPLRVFSGISAGYVAFGLGSRTIGPLTLPPASEEFGSVLQFFYGGQVGMQIELSNSFSLRATYDLRYVQATVKASEQTLFNIRGDTVPGLFEHTADVRWLWNGITASGVWHVTKAFHFEGGFGIAFPIEGHVTATESIVDPVGVTYVSGGTSRTTADGSIEQSNLVGMMHAGMFVSIPLSRYFSIEVGPYAKFAFGSFLDESSMSPTSIGLSVNASYSLRTPPTGRGTTYRSVVQYDTTVVVDPYNPDNREVRFIEVGRVIERDTMHPMTGEVITERTRISIEKHLPSPPPFLSIVVRADLDTLTNPAKPDVVVHTDIAADEGISKLDLYGIVNSDTIWTSSYSRELDSDVRWSFDKLPARYDNQSNFVIRVEAIVTDKRGQTRRAVPSSISIVRVIRR